ncbi:MAG: GGDEF domain-containing protein [Lachnospiraceae bacterium]|nr:GGDEF domain-containing protein [Lachnospiraceae bacterium]
MTVAVMCMVHAVLLGIAWYAGVSPLVYYNIFSVAVYLLCFFLCRSGHILPVYVSILLEVVLYASLGVYYVGWDCGQYYFLFSIVPIIVFFGCFLFTGSKRWIIVLSLSLIFADYALLYIGHADMAPVYGVSYAVRVVYSIFSSFVMFFSMIFYSSIYIYASEKERLSLKQKNEQLSDDAKKDALTNLYNRRGFLPVIEGLMNPDLPSHFCVAFCDIDNFKRVNDSYGHDCGDEVLMHIARIIKREMPGCEICRWGGEEIVILMRDYDLVVAEQKMEYVRRCVEATPMAFYNKRVSTTITIGLEEYKEEYREPEDIIKVADERMYYGKQHGKNQLISA